MPRRKSKSNAPAAPSANAAVKPKIKVKLAPPKPKPKAELTPYQQMVADPFNCQCTCRPDFNDKPVIPWPEEMALTVSTNADGDFWLTIRNGIKSTIAKHTITAGAVAAGTTAYDVANYTELASAFAEYRPMVLAVEAKYIGRADEAKGVMTVCRTNSAVTIGDTPAMLVDEFAYKEDSVTDGGEVSGRLVEHNSTDFVALTTDPVDTNPSSFIMITGTGLPASTACIRVRVQLHFEAVAGHTKIMSRSARVSYTNSSEISATANLIGPQAMVSAGANAYDKMVKHSHNVLDAANKAHGIFVKAAPLLQGLLSLI